MSQTYPALQSFLDVLEQPRSAAILGAGASAGLVPFGKELNRLVRRRMLACGIYPAQRVLRDIISDRILGPPNERIAPWDDQALLEEELITEHLYPGAVKAAVIAQLSPATYYRVPPQYLILNLAKYRLAIVNYNNDGLADLHCHDHAIVSVHGTTPDAATREKLGWEAWIDALQEFGIEGLAVPRLFLPQPETLDMATAPSYARVNRLLCQARRMALIGYSFGGGDDWVGFAHVRGWLHASKTPLVVVNPDAVDLAAQIAQESQSLLVHALPMYWHVLACALLGSQRRPRRRTCDHRRHCARCVAYFYEAFLDSGLDWAGLCDRYALTPPFVSAAPTVSARMR